MHYVDEGSGGPVVLVHGEPTWGFLFREMVAPLAEDHRVVVPDHMGFGKSETPQDRSYLREEHVANLEALLVDELGLEEMTLVLHDWGGPIGAGVALRHPGRVRRLFLVNTPFTLGLPHEAELLAANGRESDWFRWAAEAHADGTLTKVLGQGRHTVAQLMLELQGLTRSGKVDPTWIRAYGGPFSGQGEARGAIDFPRQVVARQEFEGEPDRPDPAAVQALLAKPATLAYGMQDRALLPRFVIPLFERSFPGAPVVPLPDAGHFTPEDEPGTLVALIKQFIALT